ncbi:hypothetical protein P280DRAFT_479591 [Massarina eburnea CBS 473.64]|uniref:Uncharacterized protein n=1 Tax=Massarina eburnea CBS 473.64 TaxID=1395130 RepID=A0A6A6S003_9PLEO|nr:hypothetical protein P280DRAFT_479591 [Massarina eburnea CBS 473.64]
MANRLKSAAESLTDPKKREKMMTDAYNKETEAHGNSKKARILSSGAFQGSLGGAGIGGAVSAGVGTLVGTVVGTVTAIPATGIGALAGAGVGAIHGPFIKLGSLASGGGGKGEKKDGEKDEEKNEKKDGEKGGKKDEDKEGEKDGGKVEGSPDDEDAVPDPQALRQAASLLAEERAKQGKNSEVSPKDAKQRKDSSTSSKDEDEGEGAENNGKKKPRKLEIRSGPQAQAQAT